MEAKFSKVYTITTNFLDKHDDLTPAAILDLFQDLSGRHSTLLDGGYDTMVAKNMFWVIARNEVVIHEQIPYTDDVEVITWPLPPTRFFFDREYEIRSVKDHKLYVTGRSRWLIIDGVKRRMLPSSSYNYPDLTLSKKEHFFSDFPSLTSVTDDGNYALTHEVLPHEIDHNLHFNNTRYTEIIYDALAPISKDSIASFLVYYHHECHLGAIINLKMQQDGKTINFTGYDQQVVIFDARVVLR